MDLATRLTHALTVRRPKARGLMSRRRRRALSRSVGLATGVALLVPSTAFASSLRSTGDGVIEFWSRSSQANRVVMLHRASMGASTVTVTDAAPIAAVDAIDCSYPNPADRRTIRCTSGGTGIDGFFDLGPGNDTLTVRTSGHAGGMNVIADGPGNDTMSLDTGLNLWINGPGDDTYRGGRGEDRTQDVRRRIGLGLGNDVIYGAGGNDLLAGGSGNDRIFGGPGNDVIFGGPGLDRMIGGPGLDRIDGLRREFALK